MPLSRRSLLKTAAQGTAAISLGVGGLRALVANAQSSSERTSLGEGFHVIDAGRTNVLAVAAGGGIALVDGGSADESAALLQRVAALGAGAVHTLFNTHWHPEHTGSNQALASAGATIVSQVNTRLWLTTDVTWPWSNETVKPLPEGALPNQTFYTQDELIFGDIRVLCGHLRDCPHTDGDMYVFFPGANVMAIGDAVSGEGWPLVDWWTGGWIGGLIGGLDMILTVSNEQTRFVPARGPVLTRTDLIAQYEMYGTIWERLLQTLYSGGGPEEALAAEPTKEYDAVMGPSEEFIRRAFESMWPNLSPDA